MPNYGIMHGMMMASYVTTINITSLTTPFLFITTRSTPLSAIHEMQFINMRCLPPGQKLQCTSVIMDI